MSHYSQTSPAAPAYSDLEVPQGYANSRAHDISGIEYVGQEQQHYNGPYEKTAPSQTKPASGVGRKIWLVASIGAIVAAMIVGAAIGGGLGASLSSCKASLSEAKNEANNDIPNTCPTNGTTTTGTTSTLTNYTVEPATSVQRLAVDCAALGASQQSYAGESFRVACGVDLQSGTDHKDVYKNTVILADIVGIIAYDFVDCLQACTIFSKKQQARDVSGGLCWSVTFSVVLNTTLPTSPGANCWLKNSTVDIDYSTSTCQNCFANDVMISAYCLHDDILEDETWCSCAELIHSDAVARPRPVQY